MKCNLCRQELPEGYIKKRGRPFVKDYAKIIELRKQGLKIKDIAEQANCSFRTVVRVIATQCR